MKEKATGRWIKCTAEYEGEGEINCAYLDGKHTTSDMLYEFAERKIPVLCEGLWKLEDYLQIIKEFKRNGIFVVENDSFLFYKSVEIFLETAKKMFKNDSIIYIEMKADYHCLYQAIKIILLLLPTGKQIQVIRSMKGKCFDSILCRAGKIEIMLQVGKQVYEGLGIQYCAEKVKIEVQATQGKLELNQGTGEVSLLSYALINEEKMERKGYLFEPTKRVLHPPYIHQEAFYEGEELEARNQQIREIEQGIRNHDSFSSKVQSQILCIGCIKKIMKELGELVIQKSTYCPDAVITTKQVNGLQPELIFRDMDKRKLSYGIKIRYQTLAFTILYYMNQKGLLLIGKQNSFQEMIDILGAKGNSKVVIQRWLKYLIRQKCIEEPKEGMYEAKKTISEQELHMKWAEMEYLWSGKLESPLVLQYLKNNIRSWDSLIRKEAQATLLLFEKGEEDYASALYKETKILTYLNQLVTKYIMEHIKSSDKETRILEIGAGTGSITDILMKQFQKRDKYKKISYYYTDLSKFFLQNAKKRYEGCIDENLNMVYRILDVDKPVDLSIIDNQKLDIIIAVGVLNNADCTDFCIQQLTKVLNPGGELFIVETVDEVPDILISQAFMMLPANDRRQKENRMFLSEKDWNDILHENGFCEVKSIPEKESWLSELGQKLLWAKAFQKE